jgi:pimeloyl-[acyl-carrier protein] methyl ester esterase
VKKPALILIAGWGHTAQALEPAASVLRRGYEASVTSTHEIASCLNTTRLRSSKSAKRDSRMSPYAKGLRSAAAGLGKKASPCVVVGWSAGAIVGLEVTCENPGSLKGLVVIGATPKFCSEEGYPWGVATRNLRAMIMGIRKDPRAVLDRFFQDVTWPAVESESCRKEKVNEAHHMGIEHLVHGLEYLRKMDLRDRLKGIEIPILIIHGREDRIVPWQAGAWLNRSLPDSRIIIHEGVGHDIPGRQPVVLASQIRAFLEDRC